MNYFEYIEKLNLNVQTAYGKCESVCKQMKEVFPELELVRGHYWCYVWGEREHWWLTVESGEVIDPTAIQFPSKGLGCYEVWDESKEEPTGKCPECGEYTFGMYVHKECESQFMVSLYN